AKTCDLSYELFCNFHFHVTKLENSILPTLGEFDGDVLVEALNPLNEIRQAPDLQ
ncbi:hypothetical protein KI387_032235, partial [Taxus chinensis]